MTPLPKRRWSTHRQGRKRATHKAQSATAVRCSNCGALKTAHQVCPSCGYYRGKPVITVKVAPASEK